MFSLSHVVKESLGEDGGTSIFAAAQCFPFPHYCTRPSPTACHCFQSQHTPPSGKLLLPSQRLLKLSLMEPLSSCRTASTGPAGTFLNIQTWICLRTVFCVTLNCIDTVDKRIRVYPNQKPWMAKEVQQLLKARPQPSMLHCPIWSSRRDTLGCSSTPSSPIDWYPNCLTEIPHSTCLWIKDFLTALSLSTGSSAGLCAESPALYRLHP